MILVIKLELQHSGLATAEVKSILGFFSLYAVYLWLQFGLMLVLLIEKIAVFDIIQCFLIK